MDYNLAMDHHDHTKLIQKVIQRSYDVIKHTHVPLPVTYLNVRVASKLLSYKVHNHLRKPDNLLTNNRINHIIVQTRT